MENKIVKGKHFFTTLFTATIFALAMLGPVQATQYAGVAYVFTDYNIDTPYNQLITDGDTDGVSVFYGHSTGRSWLFWEVDYTDFGDTGSTYVDQGKYYTVTEAYSYDAKALSLYAVGKWGVFDIMGKPLNVVARAGVSVVDATGRGSYSVAYNNGPTFGAAVTDSDTGVGPAYGVGVEYEVYKDVLASLDWRTSKVDIALFNDKQTFDADTVRLGLAYKF